MVEHSIKFNCAILEDDVIIFETKESNNLRIIIDSFNEITNVFIEPKNIKELKEFLNKHYKHL